VYRSSSSLSRREVVRAILVIALAVVAALLWAFNPTLLVPVLAGVLLGPLLRILIGCRTKRGRAFALERSRRVLTLVREYALALSGSLIRAWRRMRITYRVIITLLILLVLATLGDSDFLYRSPESWWDSCPLCRSDQQNRLPIVRVRVIEGHYTGVANYSHGSWEIKEVLYFGPDQLLSISAALQIPVAKTAATRNRHESKLRDWFGAQGWSSTFVDEGLQLERSRSASARVPIFPRSTVIRLPIRLPGFPDDHSLRARHQYVFRMAEGSTLHLIAPKFTIRGTNPPGEAKQLISNQQQLTVVLTNERVSLPGSSDVFNGRFAISRQAGGYEQALHVEMASPALRNELGSSLVDISLSSILKWLIFLLAAIFSEQLKEQILLPPIRYLFRRAGIGSGKETIEINRESRQQRLDSRRPWLYRRPGRYRPK
jgi:hypothetical protein